MNHPPQIYLASASPRRQQILRQMGVSFKVIPQLVEEKKQCHELPDALVTRLALEKAEDGLKGQINQKIPVLGSDTIVVLDGKILGKPENRDQSINMLLNLSGRTHQVMTAVALADERETKKIISISDVTFSNIDRKTCENYWFSNEPLDKAGSYGIQGQAALFIKNISGSYSGVMGLPIYETGCLLKQFGINLL